MDTATHRHPAIVLGPDRGASVRRAALLADAEARRRHADGSIPPLDQPPCVCGVSGCRAHPVTEVCGRCGRRCEWPELSRAAREHLLAVEARGTGRTAWRVA